MASRGRQSVKESKSTSPSASASSGGSDYGYRQRVDSKYTVKAQYRQLIQSLVNVHLAFVGLCIVGMIVDYNYPQYHVVPSYVDKYVAGGLVAAMTHLNTTIIRFQYTNIFALAELLLTSLAAIVYIGIGNRLYTSSKNLATSGVAIVGGLINLLAFYYLLKLRAADRLPADKQK